MENYFTHTSAQWAVIVARGAQFRASVGYDNDAYVVYLEACDASSFTTCDTVESFGKALASELEVAVPSHQQN